MKFILAIYLLLGCGMSAMLSDGNADRFTWDSKALLIVMGIHIPFVGLGWLLAAAG